MLVTIAISLLERSRNANCSAVQRLHATTIYFDEKCCEPINVGFDPRRKRTLRYRTVICRSFDVEAEQNASQTNAPCAI